MKKRKNKRILIMASSLVITAASLTFAMSGPAYAAAGWTKDGEGSKYLDENSQPVVNSLIQTGDSLYYTDSAGKQVRNQWVDVTGQTGTAQNGGLTDGWYYFTSNGRAYNYGGTSGVRKQIDGKTYAFDSNGRMETGWLDENGEMLAPEDSPIQEGVCYAGEDGALYKNQWMSYSYSDEILSDDADTGPYGEDYSEYPEIWMYFDSDCRRVTAPDGESRQKTIDGTIYGFDDHGVMLPWWNPEAGTSSNAQSEQMKFYSGADGGGLKKDIWIWMYPSANMDQKDYDNQEYSWWRTDRNGKLCKNTIKKINGKYYAFDSLGRMQTGFVVYQRDGKGFSMQFNVDEWTSDDFKYPFKTPGDRGSILQAAFTAPGNELYLFSPDELNDGSMRTGKNIKVELSDGVYTFGFAGNGVAYGNRNKVQKVKDTFYINGLRLEADEDYKYGVVCDRNGDYYVVGDDGRIVTGDKKVLLDGDGGYILLLHGKFSGRVETEEKPKWYNEDEGAPAGFYYYDSDSKNHKGAFIVGYNTPIDSDVLNNLPPAELVYNFDSGFPDSVGTQ